MPLHKTRSPEEVPRQDLCMRFLGKVSVRGLLARFQQISRPYHVSVPDLFLKPLHKLSRRVFLARFMRIYVGNLLARSLWQISMQCLRTRSPKRGVLARSPYKISLARSLYKLPRLLIFFGGPAQSQCIWACHQSLSVWKFVGKMPDAPDTVSINQLALNLEGTLHRLGN